jgi:hypothetical protein
MPATGTINNKETKKMTQVPNRPNENSSPQLYGTTDSIVVTADSFASGDAQELVQSNIDFVNLLFRSLLRSAEISHDAFVSYYIDYYLAQVNNGGFAQFVFNSRWDPRVVALIREGLRAIGAVGHAALFERGAADVAALGERLDTFRSSELFGDNPERDELDGISDAFYGLERSESLMELNAQWIRARPDLVVVDDDGYAAQVMHRSSRITDLEARRAEALEAQPEYMKLIRRLCAEAGHTLSHVTAGDQNHVYQGTTTMAWHFITNHGHHFMVRTDDKAIMFDGKTEHKVAELGLSH